MISVIFSAKNIINQGLGGISDILGLNNDFLQANRPLKIIVAENGNQSEILQCRIVEFQEGQAWNIPSQPTDDGEFRNDTIYRQPFAISVRVFVKNEFIDDFLGTLKEAQNTLKTFSIYGLNNSVYENLKILSYSKETSARMLGGTHFMLDFQEIIFVKALAQSYKSAKKAGYSNNKATGSKNPQDLSNSNKKSALLDIFE